jgi:uncharacterized protein DUF4190
LAAGASELLCRVSRNLLTGGSAVNYYPRILIRAEGMQLFPSSSKDRNMSQVPTPNYGAPEVSKPAGLAVASLVLGIVSLILCIPYLPFFCGILAIVFGAIAGSKVKAGTGGGGGMAKAGLIMGCISVVLYIVIIIMALAFGVSMLHWAQQQQKQMQQQLPPPAAPAPAPAPSTPGSSTQSFHVGLGERFEFRGVTISF